MRSPFFSALLPLVLHLWFQRTLGSSAIVTQQRRRLRESTAQQEEVVPIMEGGYHQTQASILSASPSFSIPRVVSVEKNHVVHANLPSISYTGCDGCQTYATSTVNMEPDIEEVNSDLRGMKNQPSQSGRPATEPDTFEEVSSNPATNTVDKQLPLSDKQQLATQPRGATRVIPGAPQYEYESVRPVKTMSPTPPPTPTPSTTTGRSKATPRTRNGRKSTPRRPKRKLDTGDDGDSNKHATNGARDAAVAKCQQLLSSLSSDPDASEFQDPVDFVAYDLDDYPTLIRAPMDLGTIGKRLESNHYGHTAADVVFTRTRRVVGCWWRHDESQINTINRHFFIL